MAEMAVATGTADFDASHAKTRVLNVADMLRIKGLEETRPAGSRVKLRVRAEQRQIAKPAVVNTGFFVIQQGCCSIVFTKSKILATPTEFSKNPNIGASLGESPQKTI